MKKIHNKLHVFLTGGTASIFAVLLNLVCWKFKAEDTMKFTYWNIVIVGISILALIIFIIIWLSITYERTIEKIENNQNAHFIPYDCLEQNDYILKTNSLYFFVNETEIFHQDMLVSIFYNTGSEKEVETCLGVGVVENIEDDRTTIKVYYKAESVIANDAWKDLELYVQKKYIRIKPSINTDYLEILKKDGDKNAS